MFKQYVIIKKKHYAQFYFWSLHAVCQHQFTYFSLFALLSYILVCLVQSKFRVHQANTYTYMCSWGHTHFYLHISVYIHIHCNSVIAQRRGGAWGVCATRTSKVEATILHLRTPKGPKHPCFPLFLASQVKGYGRTCTVAGHRGLRTAEIHRVVEPVP